MAGKRGKRNSHFFVCPRDTWQGSEESTYVVSFRVNGPYVSGN